MTPVIWCPGCGQRRVHTHDALCGRCIGAVEAITDPITRQPTPGRVRPLLRFLRWLGGQA